MVGELAILLLVVLLLAGAAYSGMAARTETRKEGRGDSSDTDG
jgi:hypothetical protein